MKATFTSLYTAYVMLQSILENNTPHLLEVTLNGQEGTFNVILDSFDPYSGYTMRFCKGLDMVTCKVDQHDGKVVAGGVFAVGSIATIKRVR